MVTQCDLFSAVLEGGGHYGFIPHVAINLKPRHSRKAFNVEFWVCLSMKRFRKTVDCPSSETLLAFQNGESRPADGAGIPRHLFSCEFCAAEAEFYGLYPPGDENARLEKIPEPLFELAEALLKKKRDLAPLYRLVGGPFN